VQKHQHVHVDEPFRRPHRIGHEVALPERVGVPGKEGVPRILAVVGLWLKARFFRDVLHGLARELDPEFAEFAHQLRAAEPGVLPLTQRG
jgi:hypothetical protein